MFEAYEASGTWEPTIKPCLWCSDGYNQVWHSGKCPEVKSIEYYQNGTIKKNLTPCGS